MSAFELLPDGTLRLDPWGEPGVQLEGTAPPERVDEVAAAFTDEALLTLLDRGCDGGNASERILVRVPGRERSSETGYCNEPPLHAARSAMRRAFRAALPGHDVISPPF